MTPGLEHSLVAPGAVLSALEVGPRPAAETSVSAAAECFHCGDRCPDPALRRGGKAFCCQGCLAVHEILVNHGLDRFYALAERPGVRAGASSERARWAFLDTPEMQRQLLDFTDGRQSRITLRIPAMHCVACIWLLENLYRLHPGIGESRVNFPRRELSLRFAPEKISLSELVALLAATGYEPELTLGSARRSGPAPALAESRRRWLQLGIAGFAFGNIMLLSIPQYFGLDSFSGPIFKALFGWLSLALALPALLFSAADYWRGAWAALRQRVLTLDVPIVLGLAALYAQSAVEIGIRGREGYLDSLAGLIFFLLCGRAFQQKAFDRITFERDYKSFFPLSITRRNSKGDAPASLSELRPGDRLLIRNGELIPADGTLLSGPALVDYSFVTGEAEPVLKQPGEHLYAGGRQMGRAVEMELTREVSQSYLASLWDHEAFCKERQQGLDSLTNRYSRRFTWLVIGTATLAALLWILSGAPARGARAFTSVLIVACPCALALAAPFALGTVQRLLARAQVFLKNTLVLERLARVDAIAFDKTGTLTSAGLQDAPLDETAAGLTGEERRWLAALARQSTHPHSARLLQVLEDDRAEKPSISGYRELPGAGIEALVEGHQVRIGSLDWLKQAGIVPEVASGTNGSVSHFSVDGAYKGAVRFQNLLRPRAQHLLANLAQAYELALLTGDNERERETFARLLGPKAPLQFNRTPLQKLECIQDLQRAGRTVMMVGDGLNDAGALKQSDVGVAVVEKLGIFSPASDVILEARRVVELPEILRLARSATRIVRWSFAISAVYNAVGIAFAAAGVLSPLLCAVLMPLSSVTVVLFACGAAQRAVRRAGLAPQEAACR